MTADVTGILSSLILVVSKTNDDVTSHKQWSRLKNNSTNKVLQVLCVCLGRLNRWFPRKLVFDKKCWFKIYESAADAEGPEGSDSHIPSRRKYYESSHCCVILLSLKDCRLKPQAEALPYCFSTFELYRVSQA